MRKISTLRLVALICAAIFSASNAKDKLIRDMYLDEAEDYHVHWEVDFETSIVEFTVKANTTGWVGFGISPAPHMGGADIVVGGVKDGFSYFQDYFSIENKRTPTVDKIQNWELHSSSESEGATTLKFSRLLYTCDENNEDVDITEDTQYLIWAIGANENDVFGYHGDDVTKRGPITTNLLDPLPSEVDFSGLKKWEITRTMTMPPEDTIYHCTIHKAPKGFNGTTNHIVAFDVILNSELSFNHSHHAVLYRCSPPEGQSSDYFEQYLYPGHPGDLCHAESPTIPTDLCMSFVFVWSVGGGAMVLPDDAGFFMGPNEYIMMETHYDNPKKLSGLTFDVGLVVYYTDEIRPKNAALVMVGHAVSYQQTVPPGHENFVTTAHCGGDCTNFVLPPQGVDMFSVMLHSHLTGTAMKVRHFRDEEELPWIIADNHYDFDYQANRPLRENVTLLPGDHLTLECTYTTKGKRNVTIGGFPSSQEMCQGFIWVYPYEHSVVCQSFPEPFHEVYNLFGIEELEWSGHPRDDAIVLLPESLANETYSDVLNSDPTRWTPEVRHKIQEVSRFGMHKQECYGYQYGIPGNVRPRHRVNPKNYDDLQNVTYPYFETPYSPPPTCVQAVTSGY